LGLRRVVARTEQVDAAREPAEPLLGGAVGVEHLDARARDHDVGAGDVGALRGRAEEGPKRAVDDGREPRRPDGATPRREDLGQRQPQLRRALGVADDLEVHLDLVGSLAAPVAIAEESDQVLQRLEQAERDLAQHLLSAAREGWGGRFAVAIRDGERH